MSDLLFSGVQPTGSLHIGNYLGAIRNWVRLQEVHTCIFCVVDYHALTVSYEVARFAGRARDLACGLLACGVDPSRSTLFLQSGVPEHTELAWVLNTVTPMGELERMTQYKDKAEQNKQNINAGLFTYPVLQAADILLYRAQHVPVGEDQLQHLELAREIARRFNGRFGDFFPEPKPILSEGKRVLGLDGQAKMSKSLGNHVAIEETPEEIWAKLRVAYTDPQRLRRADPGRPEVCNIFTLHQYFSPAEEVALVDRECRVAGIGCVDCKKKLLGHMDATLAPIRERLAAWRSRPAEVDAILHAGNQRCRVLARETMAPVHDRLGLLKP
jgi:tryptophanyl-tRNA synthetase